MQIHFSAGSQSQTRDLQRGRSPEPSSDRPKNIWGMDPDRYTQSPNRSPNKKEADRGKQQTGTSETLEDETSKALEEEKRLAERVKLRENLASLLKIQKEATEKMNHADTLPEEKASLAIRIRNAELLIQPKEKRLKELDLQINGLNRSA
jgi:hypothetical protein